MLVAGLVGAVVRAVLRGRGALDDRVFVARADLGTWETWSTQYRVLAIIVVLVIAYTAIRAIVPTVLRVMRPALFLAIVLIAVKPQMMAEALPSLQGMGNGATLFLSVAAGTKISHYEQVPASVEALIKEGKK